MAETIVLEVEPRTVVGKQVKQLRAQGITPAVVYGPKLEAPIEVQISSRTLRNSLRTAGGTNLIELHVGDQTHSVLARDVQRDVIKGNILHVDFYAVPLGQLYRTEVPVTLVGVSGLIRSGQGILIHDVTTVEVECLPSNIPNELTVDLARLVEVGDTLTVADLEVPEGVEVLTPAEEILVRTDYATSLEEEEEEEEEEGEFFDAEAVDVVKRGKAEEEDF